MARQLSKQRQKARQRKLERQKQKHSQKPESSRPARLSRILPRDAGQWPLKECLLTKDWQEAGQIVQILIARRGPLGQIGVGMFLMDLGCLGVKNAFGYQVNMDEYRQLCKQVRSQQKMISADLNLAAKIIREGIAYASRLGFKPHRDYHQAQPILGDANPDACATQIPLGKDGKPFFIAGPYDDVRQVLAKLERAVGSDGFYYMIPIGGPDDF